MKHRKLGRSGLEVSVLGLGTMQFGWTTTEERSFAVLDAFVEAGGTFIDTADMYSSWAPGNPGGVAEEILGRWFKDRKGLRRHVVLATKVRARMWPGPGGEGLSPEHVRRACDDSLRRLRVDELDLYQCHWPDTETKLEDTLAELGELVRKGKVRHVGLSNFSASETQAALACAKDYGVPRVASTQPKHSLVERKGLEAELLPLCLREELGVIPYSPLAGGFLTGKYRPHEEHPPSERAKNASKYLTDKGLRVLEALGKIQRERGASMGAVALAWQLQVPGITASITGANDVAQLRDLLPAADLALEPSEVAMLDAASQDER